jgi:hypothetical protein
MHQAEGLLSSAIVAWKAATDCYLSRGTAPWVRKHDVDKLAICESDAHLTGAESSHEGFGRSHEFPVIRALTAAVIAVDLICHRANILGAAVSENGTLTMQGAKMLECTSSALPIHQIKPVTY